MQRHPLTIGFGLVLAIAAACGDTEARRAHPDDIADDGAVMSPPGEDDAGEDDAGEGADSAHLPDGSETDAGIPDGSLGDRPDAARVDGSSENAPDAETAPDTSVTAPSKPDASTPDATAPDAAPHTVGDAGHDAGQGVSTPDANTATPDSSTPPVQVGGSFTYHVAQDPGEMPFDPNNTQNRYAGAELAVDLGTLDPGSAATVQINANASGYADSDWFVFRLGGNAKYIDTFMGARTGVPMGTQVFLVCPNCYPAMTEDQLLGKPACSQYLNPREVTPRSLQLGEYAACTNPLVYVRVISFDESNNSSSYQINLDVIPLSKARLSCTYPQRGGCTD
jgi:hypothetical protein